MSNLAEITKIEYVGEENLWDIEIDSDDHIYYANGIATSNSHGVSYSFPAYWAAYLKTHKPLEFYKTWLEYSCNKLDPQEEVRALVMSARLDNIEILPPSCEYLTEGFFIKGEAIVYGLTHIKGVSLREITKLFDLMKTHGVKASLPCYLTEILPNVNKRTVDAMIATGCFHYLGVSRAKLAHLYECLSSLTAKELLFFTENQFDDIETGLEAAAKVRKEGGACSTKARIPKVLGILERIRNPGVDLSDLPSRIAQNEENAIGIPLSCSYLDSCMSAGVADSTCKEIKRGKPGKRTIVVKVNSVREHLIKKSEKKMAFCEVEDDSCSIDNVVCFADEYAEFGHLLYQGAIVAMLGEISNKKSFVVSRCVEL